MGKYDNAKGPSDNVPSKKKDLKNHFELFKFLVKMKPPHKKKLSKNVLEMKFMKRTKERTEREEDTEKSQAIYSDFISAAMKHQGSRFIIEPSYVNIENLSFGRFAYHGMNPEIEKMLDDERVIKEELEAVKNEKDVQDEEMVEYYSSLGNTISKKFATKRNADGEAMVKTEAIPSTSKVKIPESDQSDSDFIAQGQKFVSNMRNEQSSWNKDNFYKRPRFKKPKEPNWEDY